MLFWRFRIVYKLPYFLGFRKFYSLSLAGLQTTIVFLFWNTPPHMYVCNGIIKFDACFNWHAIYVSIFYAENLYLLFA